MLNNIFLKGIDGKVTKNNPSKYLLDYLSAQGVILNPNWICPHSELREVKDDIQFNQMNSEILKQNQINNQNLNTQTNNNFSNRPLVNGNLNASQNNINAQKSPLIKPDEKIEILFE